MQRLIAILILLGAGPATAVPVQWVLNDVTFSDDLSGDVYLGASLTGSFVYDADTNTYSDINLLAEAGSAYFWEDWLYTFGVEPGSNSGELLIATGDGSAPSVPCGFDFCYKVLSLDFAGVLTNAGGLVSIDTLSGGSYEQFVPSCCVFERQIISGTLTGSVVPLPAAVWFFASGLGLLGWFRRRAMSD